MPEDKINTEAFKVALNGGKLYTFARDKIAAPNQTCDRQFFAELLSLLTKSTRRNQKNHISLEFRISNKKVESYFWLPNELSAKILLLMAKSYPGSPKLKIAAKDYSSTYNSKHSVCFAEVQMTPESDFLNPVGQFQTVDQLANSLCVYLGANEELRLQLLVSALPQKLPKRPVIAERSQHEAGIDRKPSLIDKARSLIKKAGPKVAKSDNEEYQIQINILSLSENQKHATNNLKTTVNHLSRLVNTKPFTTRNISHSEVKTRLYFDRQMSQGSPISINDLSKSLSISRAVYLHK